MAEPRGWRGFVCRIVRSCCPAPPAVAGLTAGEGGGSGEIQITWTPSADPAVAWYRLYRGVTPGGPYDHAYLVAPTPNPALGAVGVLELGAAERRYYRVSAVGANGREGPISPEVSGAPVGVP
jgi:hypothetical protein